MKFLKKIAQSLFGSPGPKKRKTSRVKPRKVRKPKKTVKRASKGKSAVRKKKATKSKATSKNKKTARAPKTSRKPARKKVRAKTPREIKEALAVLPLGEVTHYFPRVNAAVIKINQGQIRLGDVLSLRGHTTRLKQTVDSMQIDHKPILIANPGDEIGIRVKSRVRAGDKVYKV